MFYFPIEPKNISKALKDDQWITAMQKEVLQFECNKVWELIPKPAHANVISTKWILKNKTDDKCCVTINKSRLVAQGYSLIEGEDFGETFFFLWLDLKLFVCCSI